MMKRKKYLMWSLILLCIIVVQTGCGGGGGSSTLPTGNNNNTNVPVRQVGTGATTDAGGVATTTIGSTSVNVACRNAETGLPVQGIRVTGVGDGSNIALCAIDPDFTYCPLIGGLTAGAPELRSGTNATMNLRPIPRDPGQVEMMSQGSLAYWVSKYIFDLLFEEVSGSEVLISNLASALSTRTSGGQRMLGFLVDIPLALELSGASIPANCRWIIFGYNIQEGSIDILKDFIVNYLSIWGFGSGDKVTFYRMKNTITLGSETLTINIPVSLKILAIVPSVSATTPDTQGRLSQFTATVKDAQTYEPLEGATVTVAPGQSGTTGSSGMAIITDVVYGTYAVYVTKVGYTPLTQNVTIDQAVSGATFLLSKTLSGTDTSSGTDAVRIVLQWPDAPRDLDSHLWVPNPATGALEYNGHVFYNHLRGEASDTFRQNYPHAWLDIDNTQNTSTMKGKPETVTIHKGLDDTQGVSLVYYYGVYQYNDAYPDGGNIPSSGATVKIYDRNGLRQTFTPPQNASPGPRDWWIVCSFKLNSAGTLSNITTIGTYLTTSNLTVDGRSLDTDGNNGSPGLRGGEKK